MLKDSKQFPKTDGWGYAHQLIVIGLIVKDATADYSTDQMHAALDVNIPTTAS